MPSTAIAHTLFPSLLLGCGPPKCTKKPSQQITPPLTPPIDSPGNDSLEAERLNVAQRGQVKPTEEPLVAVMGCGYVGTHLISEFSRHYDVLGFDVKQDAISKAGELHGKEGGRATFTLHPDELVRATHFLVSVPTLLLDDHSIDTSYVQDALSTIAKYARSGSTVVIESSVAVGMTRQLLGPLARERGFFAGMSPERVDPGRSDPPVRSIPKVVSGLDDVVPGSLDAIICLYSQVFDTVYPVSKPEVAEMNKLYENCQRMIGIAFANEMADACGQHGIDPYEVCRAAATKPFGYMDFTPSLGVGGHCIPVNPHYLFSNCDFPLLRVATEKMSARPKFIAHRALDELFADCAEKDVSPRPSVVSIDSAVDLSMDGISINDAAEERNVPFRKKSPFDICSIDQAPIRTSGSRPRVLVVGVGFKRGQSVLSNSPGQQLVESLAHTKCLEVMFADPLVKQEAIPHIPRLDDGSWTVELLETFDMIIVAVKQPGLDFGILSEVQGVKIQWYQ